MRPEDQSLEDYLQGRDGLSDRYAELPMPQPSAVLDAHILAAARESLPSTLPPATPPTSATIIPLPNTRRWRLPLALAATVLLSVSVTLKLWEQPGMRLEAQMAAPEAPSVAAPAAPVRERALSAPAGAAASAAAAPAESLAKKLERRYAETMAPQDKEEAARRTPDAKPRAELRAARPEPSMDSAGRVSDAMQGDHVIGASAPVPAKEKALLAEPAMASEAKAGATPSLPPVPAPQAARMAPASGAAGAIHDKAVDNLPAPQIPAPPPAAAKPMAAPPAQTQGLVEGIAAGRAKKSEAATEPATPEAWIKEIREQLARGDEPAVREQLRRFKARYPDYVVPEDLRKWLAQQ